MRHGRWWRLFRAALPLADKPSYTMEEVALLCALEVGAPDGLRAQMAREFDGARAERDALARLWGVDPEVWAAFREPPLGMPPPPYGTACRANAAAARARNPCPGGVGCTTPLDARCYLR